jgi:hypothetical protein
MTHFHALTVLPRAMRALRLTPALLMLIGPPTDPPQITVVNMIPGIWSRDTSQNSEPSVTVNNTTGLVIGSAFTAGFNFCDSGTGAPFFVSTDDGDSWDLACMLPTTNNYPGDLTVSLTPDNKSLYATALDYYRTTSPKKVHMDARVYSWSSGASPIASWFASSGFTFGAPLQDYLRDGTDQPQVRTAPGDGPPKMFAVGDTRTGNTIDPCAAIGVAFADAPTPTPVRQCVGTERAFWSSIPASRVVMVHDTTYILMYRPVNRGAANDVVVYRRDRTGNFDALKDGPAVSTIQNNRVNPCTVQDGLSGNRAVRCRQYTSVRAGQERHVESELSIAVDPNDAKKVYIAWAETADTTSAMLRLALHFASSIDAGVTWTESSWKPDSSTNPALAVASDGAIGVMYQKLVTSLGGGTFWTTQLFIAADRDQLATGPTDTSPFLLASVNAAEPTWVMDPYIGDYLQLVSKGRNFYGIFSASNDLSGSNSSPFLCRTCPRGRAYDTNGKPIDENKASVKPSIDPYFVRVIRVAPPPPTH